MNDSRLEKKLDTLTDLLIGTLATIMALCIFFSTFEYSETMKDMSVFMAALTFFAVAMYLKKVVRD